MRLGSGKLKENSQLRAQAPLVLEISVVAPFSVQWKRAELVTQTRGSSCEYGCRFTLKHRRICSLPTILHPPTVRENQAPPFARFVQQGQDLPRDPSPLERPCLLESLDPPAVKSTRHTVWISWIPMLESYKSLTMPPHIFKRTSIFFFLYKYNWELQDLGVITLICAFGDQICAGFYLHSSTPLTFKVSLTRSPLGPLSPVLPVTPF